MIDQGFVEILTDDEKEFLLTYSVDRDELGNYVVRDAETGELRAVISQHLEEGDQ